MDGFEVLQDFLKMQDEIEKSEISENEKLFLLLAIMPNSYYIAQSYAGSNYWLYDRYMERIDDVDKYLSKFCAPPYKNIIKDFEYFIDYAKKYYNLLNKDEKIHAIRILNNVPKIFLKGSRRIGEVYINIYNLAKFFKNMLYITNGDFKYEKYVIYYLLSTNKYKKRKAFFNDLASCVSLLKQYYADTDYGLLLAFDYLEKMLSDYSIDFNISMAKNILNSGRLL